MHKRHTDPSRRKLAQGLATAMLLPAWAMAPCVQAQTGAVPPKSPALLPAGPLQVVPARGQPVRLTAQQLAALPQHSLRTATQWTDGVRQFQGPLVTDVLQAAGVRLSGDMVVQAEALNDYVVDVPASDFLRWPVILAFAMDGQVLSRRDKGPWWIVYPRDSDAALQDAKFDPRWAWQLRQLRIRQQP